MKQEKKKAKNKGTFEENVDFINQEIKKRKNKWSLTSLNWMDFDDVSQIVRIHIYEKWYLYDGEKPLGPWLYRIISNQIKNLIRNNYGNYSRPCLRCAAADGQDGCKIYESQCSDCPLFMKWEKTKKKAYNIKIPLALEDHSHEVQSVSPTDNVDIEKNALLLHARMEEILKPNEWIVYKGLFIDWISEEEVAKKLGYKTSESGRKAGYKQIKNIRKGILVKVRKVFEKGEIDIL